MSAELDWDELRSSRDPEEIREAVMAALRARSRLRLRGSKRSTEDIRRLADLARLLIAEMEERGELVLTFDERGGLIELEWRSAGVARCPKSRRTG